jgi:hypothetical protein
MPIINDWVEDVVDDLAIMGQEAEDVKRAIRRHCPFKANVAYEPVHALLKCVACGRATVFVEARLRTFQTGLCSCGGGFQVIEYS